MAITRVTRTFTAAAALVYLGGCGSSTPAPLEVSLSHDHGAPTTGLSGSVTASRANVALTPEIQQTIANLRQRYGKYHNPVKAEEDGWVFVPSCVSHPVLGGMGDHYSLTPDLDRVRGDDHVDLAEDPDFLVYAPQKNGNRKLAALDYTIPFELWTQPEPPELFGVPFRANPEFGVWMFHIWLFDPNPAGIFADFNPDVPQCMP